MRFLYMIFIMLMLSGILYMVQEAGNDVVAKESPNNKNLQTIYTYQNGVISEIVVNGSVKNFGTSGLPSSIQGGADSGSVGGFSDTFNTFVSWVQDAGKFLFGLVNSVPNLVKGMGFPNYVANFIGALWWGLAVVLFVSWLRWNI